MTRSINGANKIDTIAAAIYPAYFGQLTLQSSNVGMAIGLLMTIVNIQLVRLKFNQRITR
jgi:hypothetical protein